MSTNRLLAQILLLTCTVAGHTMAEPQAEVRLPYAEFIALLKKTETPAPENTKTPVPDPQLLSSQLHFTVENEQARLKGQFRVISFGEEIRHTPLIGGAVTIESLQPEDALVVAEQGSLCLINRRPGLQNVQLMLLPRLLPAASFTLPPCPSAILEIGKLPQDHSVILQQGNLETTLTSGQRIALPTSGGELSLRLLGRKETQAALSPPEPSTWTWQHEAVVEPLDGELSYQLLTHASANGGSGVNALLELPGEARNLELDGDDLASYRLIRGENRALQVALQWKTRDLLDRQLRIRYRMPLRPLDPTWSLQAPGGADSRTRFILPENPRLGFDADGLSISTSPDGLNAALAKALAGRNCRFLESNHQALIKVTRIPVAATADGVIRNANWKSQLEQDGATLLIGALSVEHRTPLDLDLTAPEPLKLLSCEVNGRAVQPIDLGNGRITIHLPLKDGGSLITCSFTGRQQELDPVEGTLSLQLPNTPVFIHSLQWALQLPANYQAETHGNLKRAAGTPANPSSILLNKNFCRNEHPQVQLFYQRSDIRR